MFRRQFRERRKDYSVFRREYCTLGTVLYILLWTNTKRVEMFVLLFYVFPHRIVWV